MKGEGKTKEEAILDLLSVSLHKATERIEELEKRIKEEDDNEKKFIIRLLPETFQILITAQDEFDYEDIVDEMKEINNR